MLKITRTDQPSCAICGRQRFVIRWSAGTWPDTSYAWSCLRPSHIRQAVRLAEEASARKLAFRRKYNVPPLETSQ